MKKSNLELYKQISDAISPNAFDQEDGSVIIDLKDLSSKEIENLERWSNQLGFFSYVSGLEMTLTWAPSLNEFFKKNAQLTDWETQDTNQKYSVNSELLYLRICNSFDGVELTKGDKMLSSLFCIRMLDEKYWISLSPIEPDISKTLTAIERTIREISCNQLKNSHVKIHHKKGTFPDTYNRAILPPWYDKIELVYKKND